VNGIVLDVLVVEKRRDGQEKRYNIVNLVAVSRK
jgi:hypothetical protein